jgi:hypothetical protein
MVIFVSYSFNVRIDTYTCDTYNYVILLCENIIELGGTTPCIFLVRPTIVPSVFKTIVKRLEHLK